MEEKEEKGKFGAPHFRPFDGEQDEGAENEILAPPPEADEEDRPRRGIGRGLAGLVWGAIKLGVITGMVFALVGTISYFALQYFIKGNEVVVPNVISLKPVEALEKLQPQQLYLKLDKKEFNEFVEAGAIVAQYPLPGTHAKAGTPVKITLSLGGQIATAPDLKGESLQSAEIKLRAADLVLGNIAYLPDAKTPRDQVLSQDPPAGTELPRGSEVNLLLSGGPAQKALVVPTLAGLTLQQAKTAVQGTGLEIVTESEEELAGSEPGLVLRQTPAAGTVVQEERTIRVVISK
ncbi:MAG: PASTA domain-containing protein [bacterium]